MTKGSLQTLYLGTASALFLGFLAVWQTASFFPRSKMIRQFFLEENNLVEMFALGFLLTAFVLSCYTLLRRKNSRIWWLLPAGICLLIADETSFGRVYYDWYSPLNICGSKFDALHDLLVVLPHCLPQLGISKKVFFLGLMALVGLALFVTSYFIIKNKAAVAASLKSNTVLMYLGFSFVLFCLGGGLEFISELDFLAIQKFSFLVFLEEAFETLAEYTILFAAIAFAQRKF